jgi:hypothetical protein
MLVPVTRLFRLTKCDFLLALYTALGIMVANRRQISAGSGQEADDRGQRTASQMVNLSNSQMVMNGVNDGLTI